MKKKYIPNLGIAEVSEFIPNLDEIKKIENFEKQAEKDIKKIKSHGGKRFGAGRKPKMGVVLSFQIRVSEQEKEFIQYAREHNLNYKSIMANEALS